MFFFPKCTSPLFNIDIVVACLNSVIVSTESISHKIHVWYIYILYFWLIFMVNVGKHTIHGTYRYIHLCEGKPKFKPSFSIGFFQCFGSYPIDMVFQWFFRWNANRDA